MTRLIMLHFVRPGLLLACLLNPGALQGSEESVRTPPVFHEGLPGTLVIVGGGTIPDAARERFAAALSPGGTVVILSAASAEPEAAAEAAVKWLTAAGVANTVAPQPTGSRDADLSSLSEALSAAAGVWICGGQQSRLADAYLGTAVEGELQRVILRGGVIGGTSAGAAIMSRVMIASGGEQPELATGFDLLPDAIVDQHFTERGRIVRSRLAVARHVDHFGLGIDEDTAVIVSGRDVQVVGGGAATVLLGASPFQPATETRIETGGRVDLIQIRRAARSRASGVNPGEPLNGTPGVPAGALVIVGGGGMPRSIVDRFVELAGGEQAHIVVLPTAVPREEARRQKIPGFLADAPVASVTMLPQSRPQEIASEQFRTALQQATGIWFGGGRQWNFVDAYEGTDAVSLFHDVLKRGGVIGGSSAGATIQGEFLVRGHPLGNTIMMAEGYERGLAFLPGTAIDQHFSQRGRRPDLVPVIQRHPRMLGVGIDESTALIVRGHTAEVLGDHAAHFLVAQRLQGLTADELATLDEDALNRLYISIESGSSVDLSDPASGPARQ